MDWFRTYHGISTDPKLHKAARLAKVRRATMAGAWLAVLDFTSQQTERGSLEALDLPTFAYLTDLGSSVAGKVWEAMMAVGLHDGYRVTAWDKRQRLTDSSTERVRSYRDKRKNLGLGGSVAPDVAAAIRLRDGSACVYCEARDNLCIDHVIPLQLGGTDDPDNLATACKRCNSGKSGRTPEQAGYNFSNRSAELRYWEHKRRTFPETVTVTHQNRTESDTDSESLSRGTESVTRETGPPPENKTATPIELRFVERCQVVGANPVTVRNSIAAWREALPPGKVLTILDAATDKREPYRYAGRAVGQAIIELDAARHAATRPDEDPWLEAIRRNRQRDEEHGYADFTATPRSLPN